MKVQIAIPLLFVDGTKNNIMMEGELSSEVLSEYDIEKEILRIDRPIIKLVKS